MVSCDVFSYDDDRSCSYFSVGAIGYACSVLPRTVFVSFDTPCLSCYVCTASCVFASSSGFWVSLDSITTKIGRTPNASCCSAVLIISFVDQSFCCLVYDDRVWARKIVCAAAYDAMTTCSLSSRISVMNRVVVFMTDDTFVSGICSWHGICIIRSTGFFLIVWVVSISFCSWCSFGTAFCYGDWCFISCYGWCDCHCIRNSLVIMIIGSSFGWFTLMIVCCTGDSSASFGSRDHNCPKFTAEFFDQINRFSLQIKKIPLHSYIYLCHGYESKCKHKKTMIDDDRSVDLYCRFCDWCFGCNECLDMVNWDDCKSSISAFLTISCTGGDWACICDEKRQSCVI